MSVLIRPARVAPLLAILLVLMVSEAWAFKCSGGPSLRTSEDVELFAINGELKPLAAFSHLFDPYDFKIIQIVCYNRSRGTFERKGGNGAAVMTFWTVDPDAALKSALDMVAAAQDAHFTRHSTYGEQFAGLVIPEFPSDVQVVISATSTGWSATARRDG